MSLGSKSVSHDSTQTSYINTKSEWVGITDVVHEQDSEPQGPKAAVS